MYRKGQKIVKNPKYSDEKIESMCESYATARLATDLLLTGMPLTIFDTSEEGIKTEEYDKDAPWIPKRAVILYHSVLEEGVEL